MRGRLATILVASLALAALTAPAGFAQPAAAVGKPLPDSSMRDGTLMVRVIAGDRAKPVTGADVTLTMVPPNGASPPTTQVARTDAEGRASFTDIPEAMLVKLTTAGADGTATASTQFAIPQTGGLRVLLSTVPMEDAGPPMASGQGPMTPRMMSGQPRPEAADARDAITVRISYDDFSDASSLAGVPIALVGYKHDQTVTGRMGVTDAAGRAVFQGVDVRGATAYFAVTQLPRNGTTDRVTSNPILMNGESGVRVMLSADKRASTSSPLDDLSLLEKQPSKGSVTPGQVRVILSGAPEAAGEVELVDAITGAVVQTVKSGPPLLDYDTRNGFFSAAVVDVALAPGTLALALARDGKPAAGVSVWVRPTSSTERKPAPDAVADATGAATLTNLPVGVELEVVVTQGDDAIVRQTYTLPAAGGLRSTGTLTWRNGGEGGARFVAVASGPEHTYFVRYVSIATARGGLLYLSAPFQLTPERGAAVTVRVMPRVMFSFSLTSWIDDAFLGVRGQFTIRNLSWAPFLATRDGRPDELSMPLPHGFSGAVVRDEFQEFVGVDPSKGFVIRRPIPPGGYEFIAGFSLKVDDGTVAWDMPLPLGAFESGIEIKRQGSDMRVDLGGVRNLSAEEATDERGSFFVISPITILPGKSMYFELKDLPRDAAWRRWSKVVVGLTVLAVMALIALLSLWRPRRDAAPEARFEALLDELAALEASGAEPARRAALMTQLEALYRQAGPQASPRSPVSDEPGSG